MPVSFLSARMVGVALAFFAVSLPAFANDPSPGVTSRVFGHTPQGAPVTLYTMNNPSGMSVSVMDYGATIVKILVPDKSGHFDDVVLGFDTFASYWRTDTFFGATIGRFANRIAQGRFAFGRTVYQIPCNDHGNALHGGPLGFDKRMWKAEPVESDLPAVRFSRLSPDGEEGFPGNLFVSVTYTLQEDNALRISYEATTDKPTVINLTNHTYFNLAGRGNILDHRITISSHQITPVDAHLIPTGEIKEVAGTPFDLQKATAIGERVRQVGGHPVGFDINYVLDRDWFSDWTTAAVVEDPKSQRTLTVQTDQPGLQFYTGNFLNGTEVGKGRQTYRQYGGLTLETQHYPDSPNHDNFPSTVLAPGDTYRTSTVYQFGIIHPPSL